MPYQTPYITILDVVPLVKVPNTTPPFFKRQYFIRNFNKRNYIKNCNVRSLFFYHLRFKRFHTMRCIFCRRLEQWKKNATSVLEMEPLDLLWSILAIVPLVKVPNTTPPFFKRQYPIRNFNKRNYSKNCNVRSLVCSFLAFLFLPSEIQTIPHNAMYLLP